MQPPPHSTPAVWRPLALALLAAALIALPFLLWGFRTYQLTFAATYAIAVLGLNMVTGQAGQMSLGHGAFYGLGAYTCAVLMDQWQVSAYLGIPAAGLMCLAIGYLFGRAVLRLSFFYLALATFALAMAVPQTLKSSHLAPWTGGVQGLYLDRPEAPFGLPLDQDQWWYFVTLLIMIGLFWLARNLVNSRSGRAMRAIRDNRVAAQAAGINVAQVSAGFFGVSAAFTGIAGALAALLLDFIAPDSFTFWLSILLLVGSVFGGMTSVWGALAGGLFLQFWPDIAGGISRYVVWPVFGNLFDISSKGLVQLVFGLLMVASIWLMPQGIAGLVMRARERFSRRR